MKREITQTRRINHHWILVLLALGLGVTILLTLFAGTAQTFALLSNANLWFVACIVLVQMLRYVAMTISTRVVAEIVGMRVPLTQLFQTTVAASAANRSFVGGAAGLVIRGAFFLKRGMHGGTFAAVEGVEDVVSLGVVALMFVSGMAFMLANGAASEMRWDVLAIFLGGASALFGAAVWFVQRRVLVERAAQAFVGGLNWLGEKIARRKFLQSERVQRAVDDFYRALALARHDPLRVFISFCCACARLGCDWFALYFAFRALDHELALGTVLLIFIVSSSVATIAAVPGQIGVMETTLTFMSTALGVSFPIAVSATLLYRLISFWLPIPFGYAFAWNLERKGML